MDKKIIEKSRNLWECPDSGNSCVVLAVEPRAAGYVICGDLDGGFRFACHIDELTIKLRESYPSDFEYSWTSNCHEDIYSDALDRVERRDRGSRPSSLW